MYNFVNFLTYIKASTSTTGAVIVNGVICAHLGFIHALLFSASPLTAGHFTLGEVVRVHVCGVTRRHKMPISDHLFNRIQKRDRLQLDCKASARIYALEVVFFFLIYTL